MNEKNNDFNVDKVLSYNNGKKKLIKKKNI